MNHQIYFRATLIIKKIDDQLDNTTANSIYNKIVHHLHRDNELPTSYEENLLNPKSVVIRELRSLFCTYKDDQCYHDGYGWGCGICDGDRSKHMEGNQICIWLKNWSLLCKLHNYEEFQDFYNKSRIHGMHLSKQDFCW